MHIITLHERLTLNPGYDIPAGTYLTENLLGAQLLNNAGDGEMRPLSEAAMDFRSFDDSKDWNGKKILFMRSGGFGDLTSLTPTLREIKARWPKVKLTVASIGNYNEALENLPFIDSLVRYPVPTKLADEHDAWVFLENAVERNPRAKEIPMADLFAEITGLTFKSFGRQFDGKPSYVVTPDERSWAKVQHPRTKGIRRLCVQVVASGRNRVYSFERLQEVFNDFQKRKTWELMILGKSGDINIPGDIPRVNDLANKNLTFRQSCSVLETADVFLGPDSALLHIAGALDVPAVGLFGPFPWKLRTAYSPSVVAMSGRGRCAPCFFHENPGRAKRDPFPAKCPSREKGICEVLASIEPKAIIAKLDKIARNLAS